MKDHIIREADINEVCPYCSREVSKLSWDSDFEVHTSYKIVKCDCGKKLSVKCDHIASGDAWEQKKMVPTEDQVKIIKDVENLVQKRKGKVSTLENKMEVVKEYEWKFETKK